MTHQIQNWLTIGFLAIAATILRYFLIVRFTCEIHNRYVGYLTTCRAEANSRDNYFKLLNEVLVQTSNPKKKDIADLLGAQQHYQTMFVSAAREYDNLRDYVRGNWLRSMLWNAVKAKLHESLKAPDNSLRFTYYHLRNFDSGRLAFEQSLRRDISHIADLEASIHQAKVFGECGNVNYPKLPDGLRI